MGQMLDELNYLRQLQEGRAREACRGDVKPEHLEATMQHVDIEVSEDKYDESSGPAPGFASLFIPIKPAPKPQAAESNPTKFCINCKHYVMMRPVGLPQEQTVGTAFCQNIKCFQDNLNYLVNGPAFIGIYCTTARNKSMGRCGLEAKHFEPKDGDTVS